MEQPYLMAGKRFQAKDVADLNEQLQQYSLVSNLDGDGCGDCNARRISDPALRCRYAMTQSYGDSADSEALDLCIGKDIGSQDKRTGIITATLSELEAALAEVRQDIPDAVILAGSYLR